MRILVPDPCTASHLDVVLAQLFDENGQLRTNHFLFDFGGLTITDPIAAMGLSNVLMWLDRRRIAYRIAGKAQFDGFVLSFSNVRENRQHGQESAEIGKLLPLLRLNANRGPAWLRAELSPWLSEALNVSVLSTASFVSKFRHLFELAPASHPDLLVGGTCTPDGRFVLRVANNGLDLPASMRERVNEPVSDLVAMARATEVCSPNPTPAFAELTRLPALLQDLVERNQGAVSVRSGFVNLTYVYDAAGLIKRLELAQAYFPGYLIECRLATQALLPTSTLNEPAYPDPLIAQY